jgi:hypothetical protein
MRVHTATYREVLTLFFPDAVWEGSGERYADIVWHTPPIDHDLLESLMPKAALVREIPRAVARIRKQASAYIGINGFVSAATGSLVMYSGDSEALDFLAAQAVASVHAPRDTFYCVTNKGLIAHTASQVREVNIDCVRERQRIYKAMVEQIYAVQQLQDAAAVAATNYAL